VLILLSQQIPPALHRFLNLEAGVDDDDNIMGGGLEDTEFGVFIIPWITFHGTKIYVDNFFDHDHPTELDEAGPHQQPLSWRQLPNQEDGFSQLLAEILEWSLNSGSRNLVLRQATEHPNNAMVQVRIPPSSSDFLLWRVACRVRLLNCFNDENIYIKSS